MFNRIKGTKDINQDEMITYEFIRNIFIKLTNSFNFNLVETPIIENADLYRRSVSNSDIVKKEMYEFQDKGERQIALRPEGTAGFVRSLIENKWYVSSLDPKFSYFGSMFRYEQPQKGRQRQFYQAGIEAIGDKNIYQDFEIIFLANLLLQSLELKNVLKINSIGDEISRANYQKALKEYFLPFKDNLSEINQERLDNNVLRILDDKIDREKDFVKNAPKISSFLTAESQEYFKKLLALLDNANIKYEIDYSLVRGLDYYDEIVFEFISNDKNAGAQSTLIGGGRYSNLISELGGPKISAIGWAMGVDRAAEIIIQNKVTNKFKNQIKILFAATNENNLPILLNLCNELRSYGIKSEIIKNEVKSKKIFEKAEKLGINFVLFDDKYEENKNFLIKNLINNDRMYFSHNENGFQDLLQFLVDNDEELFDILKELEDEEE